MLAGEGEVAVLRAVVAGTVSPELPCGGGDWSSFENKRESVFCIFVYECV